MKYVCSICGYVHDEEKDGVPFADLPENWVCPICRAAKGAFAPQEPAKAPATPVVPVEIDPDMMKLSPGALAAVFSNLARGCEKQYKPKEQALFAQLADFFTAATPAVENADEESIAQWIKKDVEETYPTVKATAVQHADRGTQRICVWGEKVTRMAQSLLAQYEREGEAFLEGKEVWVCTVCGFLYVGEKAPALCPVCKVPDWKFEKIEGRA